MVDVYAELLTPSSFNPTTFPNDGDYDELVVARGIPFHSLCEHHLLPFIGVAHVGYLPGERIVGLSKLVRVVELYARSLQVQERLTTQIASWLERELDPKGVGVVIEAEHMCMSLRGVQKPGATTITSALRGLVRDDPRTRRRIPLPDRKARQWLTTTTHLIVGAGFAGAKAAEALRERGLRRPDRPARRRARSRPTSARRCRRTTCAASRRARTPTSTPTASTRSIDIELRTSEDGHRDRHRRASGRAGRRRAAGLGPAPDRDRGRASPPGPARVRPRGRPLPPRSRRLRPAGGRVRSEADAGS